MTMPADLFGEEVPLSMDEMLYDGVAVCSWMELSLIGGGERGVPSSGSP